MEQINFIEENSSSCVFKPAIQCSKSSIVIPSGNYVSWLSHETYETYKQNIINYYIDRFIKTNINDWNDYYIFPYHSCILQENDMQMISQEEKIKCGRTELKTNTIYEYNGISLAKLFINDSRYSDLYEQFYSNIFNYIKKILYAINKLNNIQIVHGNLDLENIIFEGNNIKIINWNNLSHNVFKPLEIEPYFHKLLPPEQYYKYIIKTNPFTFENINENKISFIKKYCEMIINNINDTYIFKNQYAFIKHGIQNEFWVNAFEYTINGSKYKMREDAFTRLIEPFDIIIESLNNPEFKKKEYQLIDSFSIGCVLYKIVKHFNIARTHKIYMLIKSLIQFNPSERMDSSHLSPEDIENNL